MLRIAIIIGSTRPPRVGEAVALLDLVNFSLPLLDEPMPAMSGQYNHPHTRAWSEAIASCDGYVFVTPEYNHSTSPALTNAIDFLYQEWTDKVAGFIGYGYTMGAQAVEHLRLVMAALQVATVRPQVGLSLFTDFERLTHLKPAAMQEKSLNSMLDHLIAWGSAMMPLRCKRGKS